ncbi:GCN5-related N-acetyltransferase 10, chloroplastic [Lycium ferocissimum]|uniref:GCN5-related N-acetyltransferase 10, chloroplastic n=1 Tax=Lycium ferocissimum TaxID=112874 RepID=UPI0028160967|nr:GCN5-related N-acetyltransferase 10, chloroplastic [Lycium ferocissimum]
MAQCQWQPNFQSISRTLKKDIAWKCKGLEPYTVSINRSRGTCKKRLQIAQFCSSSFPVSLITREEEVGLKSRKQRGNYEVECFVNDENGWKVRRMIETEEEMRNVAFVQAEAFHEPVFMFNDMFFEFFQAEVLSGLLYRLKNSPPDRYACLVAEASSDTSEVEQNLVGVVDATVYRDNDVLQYLPGAAEYIYISGIGVLNKFRRQKVATALLKACDVLARFWGFDYLVLRAYEDDFGAQQLYTNAGYKVVSGDAPWKTKWIGRRRRVLLIKQVSHESTYIH